MDAMHADGGIEAVAQIFFNALDFGLVHKRPPLGCALACAGLRKHRSATRILAAVAAIDGNSAPVTKAPPKPRKAPYL